MFCVYRGVFILSCMIFGTNDISNLCISKTCFVFHATCFNTRECFWYEPSVQNIHENYVSMFVSRQHIKMRLYHSSFLSRRVCEICFIHVSCFVSKFPRVECFIAITVTNIATLCLQIPWLRHSTKSDDSFGTNAKPLSLAQRTVGSILIRCEYLYELRIIIPDLGFCPCEIYVRIITPKK